MTDRTGQKQVNMWLPEDLVASLDRWAGELGITRRKLVWMLLEEFAQVQDKCDDPNTLFGKLTTQLAEGLEPMVARIVKESMND